MKPILSMVLGASLLCVSCARTVVPRDAHEARRWSECIEPDEEMRFMTPDCTARWWEVAEEIETASVCESSSDCTLAYLMPSPLGRCYVATSKEVFNTRLAALRRRVVEACGHVDALCPGMPKPSCVKGFCRTPRYFKLRLREGATCSPEALHEVTDSQGPELHPTTGLAW